MHENIIWSFSSNYYMYGGQLEHAQKQTQTRKSLGPH